MAKLSDIAHYHGGDLQLSATGDLMRAETKLRSEQRVLRRLFTNQSDYLSHPEYGAGVPALIGENLDIAAVTGLIRGQMQLEASVTQTPEPVIAVGQIPTGVAARIAYTVAPDQVPAVLSFDVS